LVLARLRLLERQREDHFSVQPRGNNVTQIRAGRDMIKKVAQDTVLYMEG